MTKAKRLRAAIAADEPVQIIGAHDGLGARLGEEAGFDAIWASGLEISASAGVPDANILTMREFLDAAVQMDRATRLPVLCDCDTGFGNSNNVIHMVRSYETAGLAGVCIEDKRFPKVNSLVAGRQELAPVAEFVGKIMAAKSAQRTDDFVVVARVEALIAGWGMEEALRRAEAYHRAGADAILIHSKQRTPDEVLAFLERWARRSPVVVVPTMYPQMTARSFKAAGADVVVYANHGLRAAVAAIERTFGAIREAGGIMDIDESIAPLRRIFELQGMMAMQEDERRYLRTEAKPVRVVIPAGGDLDLPEDLSALLADEAPRALLDLYGKPLVQRQCEAFARAGVRDVTLVGPFSRDRIPVDEVAVVECRSTGMLGTIAAGLTAASDPPDDGPASGTKGVAATDGGSPRAADAGTATVVCYSDILFGPAVVETLLRCEADVAILVDGSFREGDRAEAKSLDYVFCDPAPPAGERVLDPSRGYTVKSIGKHIDGREAHFEFIGLMKLSERGFATFMERYERWSTERAGRPFGQAARFEDATLTDFLAELVESGQPVAAFEQSRGWMEIHGFADYRAAIEQLGRDAAS